MKQERLNGLMMLHVHKERLDKQELKYVAAEFSAKNIGFRQMLLPVDITLNHYCQSTFCCMLRVDK